MQNQAVPVEFMDCHKIHSHSASSVLIELEPGQFVMFRVNKANNKAKVVTLEATPVVTEQPALPAPKVKSKAKSKKPFVPFKRFTEDDWTTRLPIEQALLLVEYTSKRGNKDCYGVLAEEGDRYRLLRVSQDGLWMGGSGNGFTVPKAACTVLE